MDRPNENPPSTPPAGRSTTRGLVRWLSNSNPFYALSAVLVLLGLRMSFDPGARAFPAWAFLLGLAAYTLLMAVTACVLVRLGNVWNDVRTLLLLIVLVFLAIAMIFDDILVRQRRVGLIGDIGGALFAVALTEALLKGMRLRLPVLFRLPYHLMVGLAFLYPVAISPLLDQHGSRSLSWAVFGFSTAAGLAVLTLLPAVRRGPDYVRENGSPWRWPLFPWSLFVILVLGLGVRAWSLCWSMDAPAFPEIRESIFRPYFLVPIGLAAVVVLLEIGLVSRSEAAVTLALNAPVGLVVLSAMGSDFGEVSGRFLSDVTMRVGAPLYLTLLASAVFYGLAALRRVPTARGWLTAALVALVFVSPRTTTLREVVLLSPRTWPLWSLAALQGVMALRRPTSGRCLLTAMFAIAAATLDLSPAWGVPRRALLAVHLEIATCLAIGPAFRDPLARSAQNAGLALLTLLGLEALAESTGSLPGLSLELPPNYPLLAAAIALTYGFLARSRPAFASALTILGGWAGLSVWQGYRQWRVHVAGLGHIVLGLVSFALATLISLSKAGVLTRLLPRKGKPYEPTG
jgi:hypothetical protein